MSFTLNTINLPDGLHWADRYDWTPVAQAVEVTLTGGLIIQEAAQLAGRPITLVGGDKYCWIPKTDLDALYALLQATGFEMTLDLGASGSYQVLWRRDTQPLVVVPMVPCSVPDEADLYIIKQLCFLEI